MIEEHVLSTTIQMNRLSMDWKRTREWEDMTSNIQHGFSLIIDKPEEARDKYTQELDDNKKDWEVICHKIMQEERKNYVFLVDTIDKQLSQLQALLFALAHQVPTKEEKKAKMHRKEILEKYLEMKKARDSNAIEIWLILWRHTAEAIFDV
ncbi:hypothetical protein N7488_009107 [Penicillium malachiteum]|nr:hypothetical protein N7488_009107 [Penicillium malachiteum]